MVLPLMASSLLAVSSRHVQAGTCLNAPLLFLSRDVHCLPSLKMIDLPRLEEQLQSSHQK